MFLMTNAFYENMKMAFQTLRANKLRSFLTIFGVIIGVITVMLISSIISGIDMAVKKQVESFGTRSIFLRKFDIKAINTGRRSQEERMRKPLTMDDAEAIKGLSSVDVSVPFLDITNNFFGQKLLVSGGNGKTSSSVRLQGTLPDVERTNTVILQEGRWFTRNESEDKTDVCLIGSSVAEAYFPFGSSIGETLEVGGRVFRVIGVLEKREQLFGGGSGSNDQNNVIYMPIGSALRLKPFADDLFLLTVAKEGQLELAKDQVQDLMRVRRQVPFGEPNNFGMETAAGIIEQFQSITAGVALAMIVISSVGLLIGGIGVMNIMLVSVTERTREIGIRKAIGAKQSDILLQFLIEAATLTGFGGLVGLLIGWSLTFLIALVFPSYVPWWAPPLGFGASVIIGIVFGLFPAWKAARLDPIESLRYE
ncbi:MAG: ABC transporter permease [Acidobacteria bacterium]|nr:ABC transporter permease [Acidobacteriota bacterium]MBK8149208.1 ABC transporter permease [Acidobacteriota bacterium]MBK8811230.1 ABC transporter permease [Acidobacteriota bacterium]